MLFKELIGKNRMNNEYQNYLLYNLMNPFNTLNLLNPYYDIYFQPKKIRGRQRSLYSREDLSRSRSQEYTKIKNNEKTNKNPGGLRKKTTKKSKSSKESKSSSNSKSNSISSSSADSSG